MSGQNRKMTPKKVSESSPSSHSRPYTSFKSNVDVMKKGDRENKVSVKSHMIGRVHPSMTDWSLEKEMKV